MVFPKENVAIYLLFYGILTSSTIVCEKITFFAVEHPVVQYINPKFYGFANVTSRRLSRHDPVHYFNIHFRLLQEAGNNWVFHFYFYELLTNVYKPSFVELHRKACDLYNKDPIFGAPFRRALQKFNPNVTCPVPAGEWNMQNCTLSVAALPNFPFRNGRIYLNITFIPTGQPISAFYADFQIKQTTIKARQ